MNFYQSEHMAKGRTPNRSMRIHSLDVLPERYAWVKPTYAPRRGLTVQDPGDQKVSSEPAVGASHYSLKLRFLAQNCTKTVPMGLVSQCLTAALLSQACIHMQNPANSTNFEVL